MKIKIIAFSTSFFFFTSLLSAQEKGVVIGIDFSPGISWIKPDNDNYSSEGSSFSYSYGIDFDFYFKDNYAFSTGLQILNYKGEVSYPDLYSPTRNNNDWEQAISTANYSYMAFHLPAYLKLMSNPIGYNSFFAEFGFSFLFPLKATQTTSSLLESGNSINQGSKNIMDDTNFASVNLLLGLGIEIPISGDTKFQVPFRYLNGISSLSNTPTFRTDENGKVIDSEITNEGKPTGDKRSYYLKNLSLNFKIIF